MVHMRAFRGEAGAFLLALTIGSVCTGACAAHHRAYRDLAKWEAALQLSMPGPPDFVAGERTRIDLRLRNQGTSTIDACLGVGFEFFVFPPRTGTVNTIDDERCERPFKLEPGGKFDWSEEVEVTSQAVPGPAKVLVGVNLIHPRYCHKYGCYGKWLNTLVDTTVR